MSATPVINNLEEGKSLVEPVTGVAHDDLETRATVPNCMRLHQRLATLGTRWMPRYDTSFEQVDCPVDCSGYLAEIRALGRGPGSPLALEQILTRARLPAILGQIRRKTLIYTHYIRGIDRTLREAIEAEGWKVGFYSGDDKSGLDGFLDGDVDVLIGTGAIATGVDGLQRVCSRLIVAVLPWTAAEAEWERYHALFREARADWAVVPCEEMIRWCRQRSGYVIGDFGCGEAGLAAAVSDRHTVHSFDHVAANGGVVACDMARVPLGDAALDLAVFSLSLVGSNFADYIREAHRTLRIDGELHVIEASSRFGDRDRFARSLGAFGFDVVGVEDRWKFTHIRTLKGERRPREEARLEF
jgi:hypothetical protein